MASSTRHKPHRKAAEKALVAQRSEVVKRHTDKKDGHVLESTARALVLRNGKYGAMGSGELFARNKITGAEKYDLLAEDWMLTQQASALKAPFNISRSLILAQAGMDLYIADVNRLHDHELCQQHVEFMLGALISSKDDSGKNDPLKSPKWVAKQFYAVLHNTYMLASSWKIVRDKLQAMQKMGLLDRQVRDQLKRSENIRSAYLVTFDMAKTLVQLSQQALRVIAQNTPHYASFFKTTIDDDTAEPQVVFDNSELRSLQKSFMDMAIVDLCLPEPKYGFHAAFKCLQTIQEESPRETKRCPQAMWDAVSALSDAVELVDLLEAPLITPEGEVWTRAVPVLPQEVQQWFIAQEISLYLIQEQIPKAADLLNPLWKLSDDASLQKLWKFINDGYKAKSGGKDIDVLWQIHMARKKAPIWIIPASALDFSDDEDDAGDGRSLVKHPGARRHGGAKKRLAITSNGEDEDEHSSMPELLTASDTDDTGEDFNDSSSFEEDDDENESDEDEDDDDDSEYDSDEEEEIRALFKEAMAISAADPEALESTKDKYAEERKANPFLRLLGNLRGRMGSSSPVLKTDSSRVKVATGKLAQAPTTEAAATSAKPSEDKRTTVEEAEDEAEGEADKKKKKKKKKPKKKKPAAGDAASPTIESPVSPATVPPTSAATACPESPSRPSPSKPTKGKAPSVRSNVTDALGSSISLVPSQEQKPQSGHAYISQLGTGKTKVKTRPETVPEAHPTKKVGLLEKFGRKDKNTESKPTSSPVFAGLKKKAQQCVRKLFGGSAADKKGELRWQEFTKFMVEMGFSVDNSVAGSRVTFIPHDPKLPTITLHKPHPTNILSRWKCMQYAKDLREQYGWTADQVKPIHDSEDDELSN